MTYRIVIPDEIYEELNSAAVYYEGQQNNLGVKFLDDYENTMANLKRAPLVYQFRFKEFRGIRFARFPFVVLYEVEGKSIIIYRLIHAKRNPKKWFKK
jgi:toxin ParE1/3/4